MGFFETLRDSAKAVIRDLGNIRIGGKARVAKTKARAKSTPAVQKAATRVATKAERTQAIPKVTRAAARKEKRAIQIIDAPQQPAEFEKGKTDKDWNETLRETADQRVEKLLDDRAPKKRAPRLFPQEEMPKARRHLRGHRQDPPVRLRHDGW